MCFQLCACIFTVENQYTVSWNELGYYFSILWSYALERLKKCIKIILFDEQKFDQRTLGDVTKLECIKISANNRVMLDLSVADIIANVET